MWLGIDFALTFDEAAHVSLGETEAAMLARARYSSSLGEGREGIIDTVVHIHHGPVHYADQSGVIASLEDFDDPFAGPKAWFTKRTDLAWQCEYRFAVGTMHGHPGRTQALRSSLAGDAGTHASAVALRLRLLVLDGDVSRRRRTVSSPVRFRGLAGAGGRLDRSDHCGRAGALLRFGESSANACTAPESTAPAVIRPQNLARGFGQRPGWRCLGGWWRACSGRETHLWAGRGGENLPPSPI